MYRYPSFSGNAASSGTAGLSRVDIWETYHHPGNMGKEKRGPASVTALPVRVGSLTATSLSDEQKEF